MEIKQYGRKQISTDLSDNAVEELEPLVQKQIMGKIHLKVDSNKVQSIDANGEPLVMYIIR